MCPCRSRWGCRPAQQGAGRDVYAGRCSGINRSGNSVAGRGLGSEQLCLDHMLPRYEHAVHACTRHGHTCKTSHKTARCVQPQTEAVMTQWRTPLQTRASTAACGPGRVPTGTRRGQLVRTVQCMCGQPIDSLSVNICHVLYLNPLQSGVPDGLAHSVPYSAGMCHLPGSPRQGAPCRMAGQSNSMLQASVRASRTVLHVHCTRACFTPQQHVFPLELHQLPASWASVTAEPMGAPQADHGSADGCASSLGRSTSTKASPESHPAPGSSGLHSNPSSSPSSVHPHAPAAGSSPGSAARSSPEPATRFSAASSGHAASISEAELDLPVPAEGLDTSNARRQALHKHHSMRLDQGRVDAALEMQVPPGAGC